MRALLVTDRSGDRRARIAEVDVADARAQNPDADVQVRVAYSSLNYKDALAVTGRGPIVRADYPFVPGIDLAGRVVTSDHPEFQSGDLVLQTGRHLGERYWGGYAERVWVRGEHLVPVPEELSPRAAMIAGTAGFTAMLSVATLEAHGTAPGGGTVLVTGASGGVGSFAIALLGRLGYEVAGSTGNEAARTYLEGLGAGRVIGRESVGGPPDGALESARWSAAVDAVGGATLARVLAQLHRHASVAACGNAGGAEVETSVYPFILRGVNLLGIDSNTCPDELRRRCWSRLADLVDAEMLDRIHAGTVGLAELPEEARRLLEEGVRGRLLVRVDPGD